MTVQEHTGRTLLGKVLLLAAVVCEASYAVIGKKLTGKLSAKRITALISLWGFVLSTPFGLYLAWSFDFSAGMPGVWLLLCLASRGDIQSHTSSRLVDWHAPPCLHLVH
ncbi:hypothetical protein ACNQFN_14710 [Thauera butanivorans]|uniref:hypothetical protein n=1 Tax=Thauera butanivorans TaxID=86174 RepID=UPI003AB88035